VKPAIAPIQADHDRSFKAWDAMERGELDEPTFCARFEAEAAPTATPSTRGSCCPSCRAR
jgi:hypothetical protein